MKLATLKSGRDGRLIMVDSRGERFVDATSIAPTLQSALDTWESCGAALLDLYRRLSASQISGEKLDYRRCAAPLPRAYQWIDGSAYVNHVELMRKSRNEPLPESFWREPLLYQGGSDGFAAPCDDIPFGGMDWGVDFEAELAVVTDDVPMGVSAQSAGQHIKLYMLVNDVSLRRLIPAELATGFGFFSGKPATAFAPIAVTPDELAIDSGDAEIDLPVRVDLNGCPIGRARTGVDRVFTFPELISRAARTRSLAAGTILGGGTISNKLDGGAGLPIAEGGVGFSCIAELRAVETLRHGKPQTPWLQTGDRVSIEVLSPQGQSIFGRIDQRVVDYTTAPQASSAEDPPTPPSI